MEGATLALVIPLLQRLVTGSVAAEEAATVSNPSYILTILSFFDQFQPKYQLPAIGACVILMTLIKAVFRFFADFSLRLLMIKVGLHLRTVCVERFLSLGLSYYSKARGGNLLSYVNEQTQRCEQLTLHVGAIISETLTIFSFLVLLLGISWKLSCIALVSVAAVALSLKSIVSVVKRQGKVVSNSISDFSNAVFEIIGGIRLVKICTAEPQEYSKVMSILNDRYRAERIASAGQSAIQPLSDVLGMCIVMLLLFVGTSLIEGELVLPLLLTFLLILVRVFPRINRLNKVRATVANFGESLKVIQEFLERTESPDITDGNENFASLKREICYHSVKFSYSEGSRAVIEDVSLTIPKGKIVAFVGESGSGKSTLIDLLLRLYDPQEGRITVDGRDLSCYEIASWRRCIAVVSQDTFLFNDSVLENIRYGCSDITDEHIVSSAKRAHADEFIRQLPQGYETTLGDRGVRLSGGQKQRLAIARAIAREPEILILDEATSALDSTSEKLVQQALEEVSKNRTVIVIAHRLSTIRNADKIIVMKRGKIVEEGTHGALVAQKGKYYELNVDQGLVLSN